MKTYQAVRAEIAKLEKQAEELRRQELKTVIAQVRQVISDYGLSAADLGLSGARTRATAAGRQRAAPAGRRVSAGVAKYRDPKTGQTWTGHGRPPAWIVAAKDREAFLIAGAAPAKKKPAAKKSAAAKKKPAAKKAAAKKGRARKSGAVEIESGVAVQ